MSSERDPNDWIDAVVRSAPQRVFLRTPAGVEMSYAELLGRTARLASALAALDVVAGDRLAAQVDKSVDAVLLYLACLRMGAVFVPINAANTLAELAYFLDDCAPRVAIVRPGHLDAAQPLARHAGVAHVFSLGSEGEGSWPQFVSRYTSAAVSRQPQDAHAPAAIVYTSGTTGRSKGAVLTRRNLAANAEVLAAEWRFTERDVLLHALPLNHVHGLFAALNTVLASGSSLLLLPAFVAADVLDQLARVTVYMGVPTHYTRLLLEPGLDRAATASVRLFVSGSAPLLAQTHAEFLARTGHTVLERYGMTETLMITSNPFDGPRLPGAVGPPLPGVSVRVAQSGDVGGIGSLEVRSPSVFAGYWRDVDKTRSEFTADGWFKTGDLGRIAQDGFVYIVGRAKDLVISGGYNVYPKEVEAEMDALCGIRESAVFGVPHPDFGEGVTAAVVRESGAVLSEADIIRAIKARLAGYKIPKRVLFVDDLPRNAMGKVQKNALRARYVALYEAG